MITTLLLGIISVGILIFVHEFGHFIAARAAGIKVEVFSIGWGKGFLSFKWKDTKIQMGWIPFGGYCKMAGDSPRDELTGNSNEYYSSSPFKRIMVALSGPFFNYIFAVLLFILVVMIGYEITTYSNKIVLVRDQTISFSGRSPAMEAGLKDGDVILEIDGERVENWEDITQIIIRNPQKTLRIKILREGNILEKVVVPELEKESGRGLIGIYPWVEPVVGKVQPGKPADRAGLKQGDRILEVEGKKINHQIDFYNAIEGKSYYEVPLKVERGGKIINLTLVPEKLDDYVWAGLYFQQIKYHSPDYPFFQSVSKGVEKSVQGIMDTVKGIVMLISGKIRARTAVAGPAKLIYISGVIAKEGFVYFLQVMSYISIAFFIINLIPFPALDGSHIVISIIEIFSRKKPNLQIIYKIQTIGFIFLIIALIFVTINDISSFFR